MMEKETSARPVSGAARLVRSTINSAIYPTLALLGAFRLDWPRGWMHFAVFLLCSVIGAIIVQLVNPSVLSARHNNTNDQRKPYDAVFYRAFVPMVLIYPLFAGLDGGRLGWSSLPFETVYWGAALFIVGSAITTWTLVVNRFAERIYRHQEERGHVVITTGPYAFVRHPMYLGSIVGFPMSALMLGSGWSLIPMAVLVALFVWRTGKEDAALMAELPGYADYAKQTRYRLVPGIW